MYSRLEDMNLLRIKIRLRDVRDGRRLTKSYIDIPATIKCWQMDRGVQSAEFRARLLAGRYAY